jgi:hypothetical protein
MLSSKISQLKKYPIRNWIQSFERFFPVFVDVGKSFDSGRILKISEESRKPIDSIDFLTDLLMILRILGLNFLQIGKQINPRKSHDYYSFIKSYISNKLFSKSQTLFI